MSQTPKKPASNSYEPKYALVASLFAMGTVSALIVLKTFAYAISDSTAMLATLADSIVDVAISVMMLMAVRYSLKPADEQHRHGHGKIEGVAALFQGSFMAAAGLFIAFEAGNRFLNPQAVTHHALGITVAVIAIAMTYILVRVQKFCLKKAPSLAIEADYAHYKTDIFLNVAVILVLIAGLIGAPHWFDPLMALGAAGYFFFTAYRISMKSLDMLMDKEVSKKLRQKIEKIVAAHVETHGIHDLRTRKSGMTLHISFDVEMDPDMTLCQSHAVVRDLEIEIMAIYPHAEVLIHVDPKGDTDDTRHRVAGLHR